jgi:hypothetical protein
MEFCVDNSLFLASLLLFFLFLPHLHLLLIFLVMSINEWLDTFCKKIANLFSSLYDFCVFIISNPVI